MQIVTTENFSDKIREYKSKGNKIIDTNNGKSSSGHQVLFSKAPHNTIRVATIYVNPLQFNNIDDYKNYQGACKLIYKCVDRIILALFTFPMRIYLMRLC